MASGLSPIFSSLSGSLAGITFIKGRSGHVIAYSKQFSRPRNGNSGVTVRTAFGTYSARWSRLSDVQRKGWMDWSMSYFDSPESGHIASIGKKGYLSVQVLTMIFRQYFGSPTTLSDEPPRLLSQIPIIKVSQSYISGSRSVVVRVRNNSPEYVLIGFWLSRPYRLSFNTIPDRFPEGNRKFLAVGPYADTNLIFSGVQRLRTYVVKAVALSRYAPRRRSKYLYFWFKTS